MAAVIHPQRSRLRELTQMKLARRQEKELPLGRATFGPGPPLCAARARFANRLAASGFLLGVIDCSVELGEQAPSTTMGNQRSFPEL